MDLTTVILPNLVPAAAFWSIQVITAAFILWLLTCGGLLALLGRG